MADKEIKIKVTTEADMAQLEELKSAIEELKASAGELGTSGSESIDEIGNEADNTSSSVDELDSSVEELGNNIDGIDSTPINEVGSEANNTASSTDEAASSAEELSNSLGNIDSTGLSGASTEVDGLTNSLDNATNSANEVNNSLGIMESASFMGLAEGIGQYADGAENLAQEMNTAAISVGQLATQTGIAEPQMVSLINHISNATFPQEEAMMYVKSLDQIGVSAQNLGASATGLDRINDAFHLGAEKTNRLGQELSVLGVDMNNVSSSFNALAYANANTVGGMDNYFSFLQKYDAQFKELGFNVDQASVIIAGATQKFGGGRAALSGLSTALKECNGDTRALEQALGLEAGSISNASQLTGQYAGQLDKLADEEGEHKTWLDQLNAAWEDMSLSLSPILSPLMSFVGLIGQIGQFALAANSIVTLAQTLGILKTANEAATISQMSLNLAFLTNPVFLVVVAIIALIAILWYLYNTNEDVRNAIDWLGQTLWSIGEVIYSYLVAAIQWLGDAWQWVVDLFTNGGQTIQDTLGGAFQWLLDIWNQVVNAFYTYAPLIAQVLFVMATGGIGAIVLLIANMNGMPNQLGQIFQNALGRVGSFVGGLVSGLVNGASNAVHGFIGYIQQMPGMVAGELDRIWQTVVSWGQNLANKFSEIGGEAYNALKRALGIGSPGYMYYMMEGELGRIETILQHNNIPFSAEMLGKDLISAWNNPQLKMDMNIGATSNNTNSNVESLLNQILTKLNNGSSEQPSIIFNHYGDIDNEDRMEKTVDAVIRALKWDNETAGRTV